MKDYKSNNKKMIAVIAGLLAVTTANAEQVNFQAVDKANNPLFSAAVDWQISDDDGKPLMKLLGRHRFSIDLDEGVYSLTLTCPNGVKQQAAFSAPRTDSVVVRCSG